MSSIDLLVASPTPFSADTGADALTDHPGLYPTNDPLGLGLDLYSSLPLTLPGSGQTGITWENLTTQGTTNTTLAESQGAQQKPHKIEKPRNAEKEPQIQMIQASRRRRRSKTDVTSGFHTKVDQRERFLECNRLAASRCRQKKKDHTQRLETRFTEEEQKKRQLEGDITALRDEILSLKDEILKHALCEDRRVGRHLAHTMQQITQNNNAGASSSSVSASSSGSSSESASLAKATSRAATAASLPDESSSGESYVEERKSGDINGETMSVVSEASHPFVNGTQTDLIDAYTYLT